MLRSNLFIFFVGHSLSAHSTWSRWVYSMRIRIIQKKIKKIKNVVFLVLRQSCKISREANWTTRTSLLSRVGVEIWKERFQKSSLLMKGDCGILITHNWSLFPNQPRKRIFRKEEAHSNRGWSFQRGKIMEAGSATKGEAETLCGQPNTQPQKEAFFEQESCRAKGGARYCELHQGGIWSQKVLRGGRFCVCKFERAALLLLWVRVLLLKEFLLEGKWTPFFLRFCPDPLNTRAWKKVWFFVCLLRPVNLASHVDVDFAWNESRRSRLEISCWVIVGRGDSSRLDTSGWNLKLISFSLFLFSFQ